MSKKIVSVFLAFLFISITVPFAFAAEPVELTEANVSVWPTTSGSIYFGQKISDGVTLVGGEVQYNSTVVDGHFEFTDANFIPTSSGSQIGNITFVPNDTSAYKGFVIETAWDVTYQVKKTTPVLVDENNPPIATRVEEGAKLSTSILSGGLMKNPYNESEPKVATGEWEWTNRRTVVTESGYYEAEFYVKGYEGVTMMVYVGINGDIIETTISEIPLLPALTYDGSTTWNDITLSGGIAVEKDTTNVVEGTFSITDNWKIKVIESGSYEIDATFTPNDAESYTKVDFKIPVTVNKAPIRFVDENGEDIVPEITVPYGTKFNDISRLLKPYVKGPDYTYFVIGDLGKEQCEEGTYTFKATAPSDGANYEDTDLTFKIVVEKKKLNPKLYSATGKLYINDNSAVYHPTGTFTLEYTIDGVEQTPITGIKYNTHFDWNPTKSGNYEYTIIYNEAAEKEYFIIDDFTTNSTIALTWGFKATGSVEGTTYKYGSEVALEAPATDPAKEDKPFYGFVKWEDANGNTGLTEEELSNKEISFIMPDGDVELNATYKFDFCLCIRYYIQIVVDWFNSFFQSIGTLF